MKNIKYHIVLLLAGILGYTSSCSAPEYATPVPNDPDKTPQLNLKTRVLFVNAAPDAPTLNFLINNLPIATLPFPVAQTPSTSVSTIPSSYVEVPITSNGVGGNIQIRAKNNVGGPVGGLINGATNNQDLIYRAGSTNLNNLSAVAATFPGPTPGSAAITNYGYTIFATDTLNRPTPKRTVNALGLGDTTFYNSRTGAFLSVEDIKAIRTSNNPGQANYDSRTPNLAATSWLPEYIVPIGLVPLGTTDPGGLRFLVTADNFISLNTPATQAAIRFINLVPTPQRLSGNITFPAGTTFPAGANPPNFGGYAMNFAGFNTLPAGPALAVGSRLASGANGATAAFSFTSINAGTLSFRITRTLPSGLTEPDIVPATSVSLSPGVHYTIALVGQYGKTGDQAIRPILIIHK
jgi:hypothetical protein